MNQTAIVHLLLGIVLLLLGRRLFWFFVGVAGFLVGMNIAEQFVVGPPGTNLLIAIVAGILGAVIAIFLQKVASDWETILDNTVHRPESLRWSGGFESSHLSLTLSDRLMRDFSPIVSVAFGVVHDRRHDSAARCLIALQLVGDQSPRFPFLTLQ